MNTVGLIDNGGANLASVEHALRRLGAACLRVSNPEQLAQVDRAILPGVGSAADAMQRLRANGLVAAITGYGRPLLGVCLGLQLLFDASEEGSIECLGLFPGRVVAFAEAPDRVVPHMGWNRLSIGRSHPVLSGIGNDDWFYFVHGFHADITQDTVAVSDNGIAFAAVAARDNVVATQFHPERSASAGAKVLENFLEWSP